MAWTTHEVVNQFDELTGYNLFATDACLRQSVRTAGADWFSPELDAFGARIGSDESFRLADEANRHPPELKIFDRRGRRIDEVEFHPSWHVLSALCREQGLISLPFSSQRPGRWAASVAGLYLHGQVEAGTMCPAAMTQACIPVLQKEPALWAQLQEKLYAQNYDSRDIPLGRKASISVGMGMTEKQGGSDVRANTTRATPIGAGGRGGEYTLRGHKWFFSAPMCDAHLVTAQTNAGPSCFYVPRWRPDGSKNEVRLQRLKDKIGNRSNASAEVEFADALGIMIGEDGRGIPTIIEMATYTRLSCVIFSAAILRQCAVQAIAYTRRRRAFGRRLVEQPLMCSVLADMVLESEAAALLMMRLAKAFEETDDPRQRAWKRIMTPAAKFWVCKRAIEFSGEAIEAFGGNGFVEGPMARLFREAPLNSIWEGAGNVMCLDVARAIAREPEAASALLDELAEEGGDEPRIGAELKAIRNALSLSGDELEASGRRFAQRLVLTAQACLLRRQAPAAMADGFLATRFDAQWGRVVGAGDMRRIDVDALIERAYPI
jgi:putative acyl-CoA dehydrogenase